jgi:hypothetical protein
MGELMNRIISNFIDNYTNEIINGNAAMFIGAGFSKSSGFVDWKGLLEEAAGELELDVQKEDLISLAQYYVNKNGRPGINRILENEFLQDKKPCENHRIIARMPVNTFWTTNYDSLLEDALSDEGKTADVKYCNEHLSRTIPNRDAIVYKMHGDKSNLTKAIIIKDDYEKYYRYFAPFITALCGELVSKTFLFLGFSFMDPNLDYILSRIRIEYGEGNVKQHYAILREVNAGDYSDNTQYEYDLRKQKLFFEDLTRRYNIKPVIVKEYSDITWILKTIEKKINMKNIFISGSAEEYGSWSPEDAKRFIHLLSKRMIEERYNIVSGFGLGVGSYVITGALEQIYLHDKKIDTKRLLLRPFPQGIIDDTTRKALWTKYREDMIFHSGIAVFIYGNKRDSYGNIIEAGGMAEEYQIAKQEKKLIIPVGCTGYVANRIWREVNDDFQAFYAIEDDKLKGIFGKLNEKAAPEEMCDTIIEFIRLLHLYTIADALQK